MHLDVAESVLLGGAGLAAGAINSAAGGGSLISFPALVAVGYPALAANVTNTVALCPGYLGGVLGYRTELVGQRARIVPLAAVSVAGSIAGAVLLATTSPALFRDLAPALVLIASALLALQPTLARALGSRSARRRQRGLLLAQLPVAAYGSYFGAGLGVVQLASLGAFVDDSLQRLNALKGLLALIVNWVAAIYFVAGLGVVQLASLGAFVNDSLQRLNALKGLLALIVNWVAAIYFVAFEPVSWEAVLIIAPASLIGGRAGVVVARRLSDSVLRIGIVCFGVGAAAYLFAVR